MSHKYMIYNELLDLCDFEKTIGDAKEHAEDVLADIGDDDMVEIYERIGTMSSKSTFEVTYQEEFYVNSSQFIVEDDSNV